jgi:hypothetical protein
MGMDPDPEPNFSKGGTGINSRGSKFHAYFFDFFCPGKTIIQSHSYNIRRFCEFSLHFPTAC